MGLYKCMPSDLGVDVLINNNFYFTFTAKTHMVTDLGEGRVRISRRISVFHEIYDTPVTEFVDAFGVPLASTAADLQTALSVQAIAVKAGAGTSVVNGVVSLISGGPDTIGGFKVGTGLIVDGTGKLSASASSEVTKVLSTEAAMLALAVDSLRSYRVIRMDTKRLYYLNANDDAAVLSNWFVGPSIDAVAVTFNDRSGAVVPEFGDYTHDLVPVNDKSTNAQYKFTVDDGKLYLEGVESGVATLIPFNADLESLNVRVAAVDEAINNASTGINNKIDSLSTTVDQLNTTVNDEGFGLTKRIEDLETKVSTPTPTGVTSFNGRTGAVRIENGDVTTTQITETVDRNFLNQTERAYWNNKAEKTYVDQSIQIERSSNDALYPRITTAGKAGGYAPLDSTGKVEAKYLPNVVSGRKINVSDESSRLALGFYADLTIAYQSDTGVAWALNANQNPAVASNWSSLGTSSATGVTSFNGRAGDVNLQSGDVSADIVTTTATRTFVNPAERTAWNAKVDQVTVNGRLLTDPQIATINSVAGIDTRVTNLESASKVTTFQGRSGAVTLQSGDIPAALVTESSSRTFVTPTERALWNLKLDANQRGVTNGVAPLDANGRVPVANLPVTSTARQWRSITAAQRTFGTWRTNTSGNEMELFLRSNYGSTANRYFQVSIRKSASESTTFLFNSNENTLTSSQRIHLSVTIPVGWQYLLNTNGSTAASTTDLWYELS